MIIRRDSMKQEIRENMRGGDGAIEILHFDSKENMENCRLLAEITIPVGGSIGEHQHDQETEYYIITEGEGSVIDDGAEKKISAGDVVKTGGGASHSIKNTGEGPLKFIAAIITY